MKYKLISIIFLVLSSCIYSQNIYKQIYNKTNNIFRSHEIDNAGRDCVSLEQDSNNEGIFNPSVIESDFNDSDYTWVKPNHIKYLSPNTNIIIGSYTWPANLKKNLIYAKFTVNNRKIVVQIYHSIREFKVYDWSTYKDMSNWCDFDENHMKIIYKNQEYWEVECNEPHNISNKHYFEKMPTKYELIKLYQLDELSKEVNLDKI